MRTGGVLTAYRELGSFALRAGRYSGRDLAISHDGLTGYSARKGWEQHRQHRPERGMRRNGCGYTHLKTSDQHRELVLHLRAHGIQYRYILGMSKKKGRSLGASIQQPKNDKVYSQGSKRMARW